MQKFEFGYVAMQKVVYVACFNFMKTCLSAQLHTSQDVDIKAVNAISKARYAKFFSVNRAAFYFLIRDSL